MGKDAGFKTRWHEFMSRYYIVQKEFIDTYMHTQSQEWISVKIKVNINLLSQNISMYFFSLHVEFKPSSSSP